jgi:hypothetical protein
MEKPNTSLNSICAYATCAVVHPTINPYEACPCCDSVLTLAKGSLDPLPDSLPVADSAFQDYLQLCESCGWWFLRTQFKFRMPDGDMTEERYATEDASAFAVLKRFPLGGIDVPIDALKDYLTAHYVDRFDIYPRKLEELIAYIFRDFGYSVELTSYSKDGIINLSLLNKGDGTQKVVQVTRYKRPIQIADVDTFLGAMVQHHHYHGIYVTTSHFTKGARYVYTSNKLPELGYTVELMDAASLFDALKATLPSQSSNPSPLYESAWILRNQIPKWHSPNGWRFDSQREKQAQLWVERVEMGGEMDT